MTQDAYISPPPLTIPATPPTPPQKKQSKKTNPLIYSWLDEPYSTVRGESALWIAVITQAMMDALSRSSHPEHSYHKQDAINWLTGGSKDFYLVCMFAGLDPDYVRRKAKKAMTSPVAWRAAPGEGKRYLERKAYRQRAKRNSSPPIEDRVKKALILTGPWQ